MVPEVLAHVRDLSAVLATMRPDLVGVYLHGSAVLGGFRAGASDVDVLAVVARPTPVGVQRAMGAALAAVAGCPGSGLELSVVTARTAAVLGACRFEVHVNTTGPEAVVVPGAGHRGDRDLVLHCAVCRQRALPVTGPPAGRIFGAVSADRVTAAMIRDVRWAVDGGRATYAVLNACRATRFADDGRLCSKLDGGHWYLTICPGDPVVTAALAHQRGDGPGPDIGDAARFAANLCARLRPPTRPGART
jgi:streptomycin 3"-adenylyltransferase